MPPKPDISVSVHKALVGLSRKLFLNPDASTPEKQGWYIEVCDQFGQRTADVAWAIMERHITKQHVTQYFVGENKVSQNQNPGGTNVTQIAGGNQTGVNATGDQRIRDITVFSQDLDQTGAAINQNLRSALVEARRAIEADAIEPAMKPLIIDQFDKLTEELKKGDAKNPALTSMLWNMLYGAVKGIPTAVAALAALDKLRQMLGY